MKKKDIFYVYRLTNVNDSDILMVDNRQPEDEHVKKL